MRSLYYNINNNNNNLPGYITLGPNLGHSGTTLGDFFQFRTILGRYRT